ncbi:MAG: hypothetical protein KDD10_11380 [Phaeodactylibacter sp.]|nr:hypothetical protein [Phaeodactylibacter sp.]MCB9295003.1 hypothetical protein [Lewinellaceae bacterium]
MGSTYRKPANHPDIHLEWATPAFPGYNVQYACRLPGSPDSNWVSPGTRREPALPRIPFGKYQLDIRLRGYVKRHRAYTHRHEEFSFRLIKKKY